MAFERTVGWTCGRENGARSSGGKSKGLGLSYLGGRGTQQAQTIGGLLELCLWIEVGGRELALCKQDARLEMGLGCFQSSKFAGRSEVQLLITVLLLAFLFLPIFCEMWLYRCWLGLKYGNEM